MKASDGDAGAPRPRKRPGRQPVSCAECRRLKMKCDRNHPCENCRKRGCAAICPDGTLTTGKHNRMILANTEELHDKIEELLDRIRVLEDALQTLQGSVSTQPHPLLSRAPSETLSPTVSLPTPQHDREDRSSREVEPSQASEALSFPDADDGLAVDALGTLSIGAEGETHYLGQSARADYLFHESDSEDFIKFGRLPRCFYGYTWPEPLPPDDSLEETILSFLPDLNEARGLCEIYLRYTTWLPLLISRETLYEELVAHVYHLHDKPWADTVATCPHRLSLLFAILAIGALFDPRRVQTPDADDYYHLSRVALALKSPVTETTVNAVSAILHIAFYLEHCESSQGHEKSWLLLGVAAKLSLSMGLHRDSAYWKLDSQTSQRRHEAFWQLYVMDAISSLQLGRPPTIPEEFVDCPLPKAPGSSSKAPDDCSYNLWILRFSRVMRRVLKGAYAACRPSYATILALELEIRDFAEPWEGKDSPQDFPRTSMQRWVVLIFKEAVLLHLHRSFFLEAISDIGLPLSKSKYAASVNASFESSRRLIDGLNWINSQVPVAVIRMSSWFGIVMTATTSMCLLVTRYPRSEYVRPALDSLERMHALLQGFSSSSPVARKNLDAIMRLRTIARSAVDISRVYVPRGVSRSAGGEVSKNSTPPLVSADDAATLERCCGRTQLRARRVPSGPRTNLFRAEVDPTPGASSSEPGVVDKRVPDGGGGWMAPPGMVSPTTPMTASTSSSCAVDLRSFSGLPTEASGSGYSSMSAAAALALDPMWSNFIQQVGF